MIELLGYDSSAAYALTLANIPEWQQQTGSWLWLRGTAVNKSELEEIGCLFAFQQQNLADCQRPQPAAYVDAYHRYIFASLPILEAGQVEIFHMFLGHNFLVTLTSAPVAAVDSVWARYQAELRLWGQGPDYLLHLLIEALVEAALSALAAVDSQRQLDGEHKARPTAVLTDPQWLLTLRYRTAEQFDVVAELAQSEHDLIDANVRHQLHHSRRRLAGLRRRLEWQQEMDRLKSSTALYLAAGQAQKRLDRLSLLLPGLLALMLLVMAGILLLLLRF